MILSLRQHVPPTMVLYRQQRRQHRILLKRQQHQFIRAHQQQRHVSQDQQRQTPIVHQREHRRKQ
jgi:hypothetical protein